MISRPPARGVPAVPARQVRPGNRRVGRRRRARRRLAVVTLVVLAGAAGALGFTDTVPEFSWNRPAEGEPPPAIADAVSHVPTAPPSGEVPAPSPPAISYPTKGAGTWHTASGRSGVLGTAGPLLDFRVAVEKGIEGLSPEQFAQAVTGALGDRRSWTGAGQWRMRRVGPGDRADFTVFLVTPATRDRLCVGGYDRYTSCREGNSVVINVARWVHGVPHYGAPLDTYRQYVINHEVGHRLGFGHELCPRSGEPAPVMQQQTLALHGCTANAWPLRGGKPYHGRSGAYDDPVPPVG